MSEGYTRRRNKKISAKGKILVNEVDTLKSDYDKRIHGNAESYLSYSSGFQNYRGLLNNCIVLLILSSFRLALDNLLKYGILIDPLYGIIILLQDPYTWPCTCLIIGSNIFIQVMFIIERYLASGKMSATFGFCLHCLNLFGILVVPVLVVIKYQPLPNNSVLALIWYTILWLKSISYISVNKWLREGNMTNPPPILTTKDGDSNTISNGDINIKKLVKYPDNLNEADLYYFMVAPTLCYELNFPRTNKIRVQFLLRRIAECLFLVGVIMAIVQQWMVPTIKNSFKPFNEMDYPRMVERIMKLAVPNHLMWLLFFYCFFHSFLNIVAELLRFGDRTFYKDWWNSSTIPQFWKTWNIPVHRWAQRHLYFPLRRRGYSQITSSLIVFSLSAFFHEYLVSIPLQMFRVWAFFGMVSQEQVLRTMLQLRHSGLSRTLHAAKAPSSITNQKVPLALVGSFLPKESAYGNMFVWLSLILGQPIAIMMYGHDFYVTHSQSN